VKLFDTIKYNSSSLEKGLRKESNMKNKKLQVFISSTYRDLIKERQAAVEALLELGHIPAGMELFQAGSESQLEIIKQWIEESDVYMLILGGRYGTLEPISELSYTHLEYLYALELGKPVFSMYIDDSALEQRKAFDDMLIEKENLDKYIDFKKLVMSRICVSFEDHKDVKFRIAQTMKEFEKKYEFDGWISGKETKTQLYSLPRKNSKSNDLPTPKKLLISDRDGLIINPTVSYESSSETFMKFTSLPISFENVDAIVRIGYHSHGGLICEVSFSEMAHALELVSLSDYTDENDILLDKCVLQATTYNFNSKSESLIIAIQDGCSIGQFWVYSFTTVGNIEKINPMRLELSKTFQSKIEVFNNVVRVPIGSQGYFDEYTWFDDAFYEKVRIPRR